MFMNMVKTSSSVPTGMIYTYIYIYIYIHGRSCIQGNSTNGCTIAAQGHLLPKSLYLSTARNHIAPDRQLFFSNSCYFFKLVGLKIED